MVILLLKSQYFCSHFYLKLHMLLPSLMTTTSPCTLKHGHPFTATSTLPSFSQHECNFKHLHNIHLFGGFQALFPPSLCQHHLVPSLLLLCHTQTLLSSSFQMRNTRSGVGHKGDKGSEIIHKLFTNSFSELDSSASAELKWGSIPILSREKKTKAFTD